MKERFNRERVRIHVYRPEILVIQGWIEGDREGQDQFEARLGEQPLEVKITTQQGIEVRKKYLRYKADISVEYFLWITLPLDFQRKTLHVFHKTGDERREIYRARAKSIRTMQQRLDSWVEALVAGNQNEIRLRGWLLSPSHYRMALLGKKEQKIKTEVDLSPRMDVKSEYPEAEEQHITGFEMRFKKPSERNLRLVIQNKQKHSLHLIDVQRMLDQKESLKNLYQKGMIYLRGKGFKSFTQRVWTKLMRLDQVNYENFRRKYEPTANQLNQQRSFSFAWEPKISIVVPLFRTQEIYLQELVQSIKRQTYKNWQLCLSDGSGADSPLRNLLERLAAEDQRIQVIHHQQPLRISENTNAAIEATDGEYIAFADHDDLLAENALYECVTLLNKEQSVDFIYTDEDKVTMDGKKYFQPHFKSDYNPDLLRSMNYICHLVVVKREIIREVGLLNPDFDGAQDYDFVLRCTENCKHIAHIPKVLYHWRAHADSTAENPQSKRYAFLAGQRAVQAHYERSNIKASVKEGECPGLYISDYEIKEEPLISIIIPNKDHAADLIKCLESIEQSDYQNYEVIIIENNSTQEETFAYYRKLGENPKYQVVYYEGIFNYSKINNYGVTFAGGDYYLFLNNDTQMIRADCLRQLLGYCTRNDVGAVGARLYYEDNTIQHAGVILGFGGIAGHAFIGSRKGENGYFSRIHCAQNMSAVTAACMMVKAKVFRQVQGFTEELAVAFNDIDLCMKIRKAGNLIVYNPYAELYHFESKSRGLEDTQEKIARFNEEIALFMERWADQIKAGDPYYNPNLSLDKADFSLKM